MIKNAYAMIFSPMIKCDIKKNHIRLIRVSCHSNELMLVCHVESQSFQDERCVRYLYDSRPLIILPNRIYDIKNISYI